MDKECKNLKYKVFQLSECDLSERSEAAIIGNCNGTRRMTDAINEGSLEASYRPPDMTDARQVINHTINNDVVD
jgi:hypothetical protein